MKKVILINIVILLVVLVGLEISLRYFPIRDPYSKEKVSILHYFKPTTYPNQELRFIFEDSLPGFSDYKKEARYITNNMGFRGTVNTTVEKADDMFRVFAIGGSTTQSYVMDEGDDWPSLLNDRLDELSSQQYEVINTGQSGHSLSDHLHLIIQRLIHLNPDLFILYAGANDIDKLLTKGDLYQTDIRNARKTPNGKFLATEFQIGRRLHYAFKGYNHNEIRLTSEGSQKARDEIRKLPLESKVPDLDMRYPINNLKAIIGICRSMNIKLVVVGQAVSWDETSSDMDAWHFMVNKSGKRYDEKVLNRLNLMLNEEMSRTCESLKVPYFNAQEYLVPNASNFYDDMHLNFEGNTRMAQIVYNFLKGRPDLISLKETKEF